MIALSDVMTVLNIVLAVGAITSATISWLRGGWIRRFIKTPEQLDSIERKVDEVNEWRNDVDAILLGLSKTNEKMDDEQVSEMLNVSFKYQKLMNGKADSEDYTEKQQKGD